jgi:hypothetical protein
VNREADRPFLLCIDSDPAVRRALLEAAGEDFRLHFEDRLDAARADRAWTATIPPMEVALVELPDASLGSLALLARLRRANEGMPIVVSICYGGEYQLASEQLAGLCDRVVFRPFDLDPLLRTLQGSRSTRGVRR